MDMNTDFTELADNDCNFKDAASLLFHEGFE